MPRASYPAAADVAALFVAAGIAPEVITPLNGFIPAAIALAIGEWERRTGWHPYLADSADSTRYFDPPTMATGTGRRDSGGTRRLDLRDGLISLTSLTVTGTPFNLGLDFFLGPDNAAARGKPWQWVNFLSPMYGLAQSIAITGRWGCVAEVPDELWMLLVQLAALDLAPAVISAAYAAGGGGIGVSRTVQIGPTTIKVAPGSSGSDNPVFLADSGQRQMLRAQFDALVRSRKRIVI